MRPAAPFEVAFQIGLVECSSHFETIIGRAGPLDDTTRRLYRITLANYFAAAALMPYAAFHAAAEALSYDVQVLGQRFNVGFEQICHRLTTLQRPNARGVPFFMLRVDNAGNVSKRFSSGTFPFSKFGGTCPLWNVHSTFDTPDRLLSQVIELPDGSRYFSIRTDTTSASSAASAAATALRHRPRLRDPPRRQAGLFGRPRSGEDRRHADRRQVPRCASAKTAASARSRRSRAA